MKPIQVYVTEEQHKQLKQQALDRGLGISDIVRERLFSDFKTLQAEKKKALRPAVDAMIKEIKPILQAQTKGSLLDEIRDQEMQRDGELEFCQDSETAKEIRASYETKIQNLWKQYRELE